MPSNRRKFILRYDDSDAVLGLLYIPPRLGPLSPELGAGLGDVIMPGTAIVKIGGPNKYIDDGKALALQYFGCRIGKASGKDYGKDRRGGIDLAMDKPTGRFEYKGAARYRIMLSPIGPMEWCRAIRFIVSSGNIKLERTERFRRLMG